jgi:hypothetical protein
MEATHAKQTSVTADVTISSVDASPALRSRQRATLFESCRYVVLNPVRAGLCGAPEDWRWSSYRACAGLEAPPTFLATQELLQLFAANPDTAARSYRAYVTSE